MYFKYILFCVSVVCVVYCRPPNVGDFYVQHGHGSPEEVVKLHFESIDYDKDPKKKVVIYVVNGTDGKLKIQNKSDHGAFVAVAEFRNSSNITGWSYIRVTTNGSCPDLMQAEAAGIAEGFITADFISMQYQNMLESYCENKTKYCAKLNDHLNANMKWIKEQIANNPKSNYWKQINLVYQQVEGIYTGYLRSQVKPDMTYLQFRYMQLAGDLEELETFLTGGNVTKILGSGSCSALIKLFPNNADLAISHVTWDDYRAMLRIYKLYNFTFHNADDGEIISGSVQSFSSYPGVVASLDDFYILSSGLVTQETTIGNTNKDLLKYIDTKTVFEWARTVVANRIASDGNQWCSIFEKANSGTYNNQWMILDYKLFKSRESLKPDTLWILEQIPGSVHMADMTVFLEQKGYWASYNLPFFGYVYNISGVEASRKQFGDWFDYHLSPRAQIFNREQSKVVDMQSLVKLMRYNDFKNDPLSKCKCNPPYSAENAISSRSDLNPANGTYPFGALAHRRHGGTDVKATSAIMSRKLSQFIAAGPTFDLQPAFQWSKTEWKKPLGHPDIFQFGPVMLDWSLEDWIVQPDGN